MKQAGQNAKQLGSALMGCGCLIMLLPIVAALLFIVGAILSAGVQ